LRPDSRKLKQSLLVLVGFGVAGRKDSLFSILPELICFRHEHPRVPQHPNTRLRFLAVAVCSKLLTWIARPKPLHSKAAHCEVQNQPLLGLFPFTLGGTANVGQFAALKVVKGFSA